MKIAAMSSSTPIAARLNQELATQQEFNKHMLLNLLSCIQFLARQDLPFRGHIEDILHSGVISINSYYITLKLILK